MVAARAVARRAAVFAMFLVIAMLVLAGGAVVAAAPIARASAVSAFCVHVIPDLSKDIIPRKKQKTQPLLITSSNVAAS